MYPYYLRKVYKMDIGKDVRISWKAHLDKSVNPKGIHIEDGVRILNGAMILAHDDCRRMRADTIIGRNSIVGVRALILPGVVIGESSIVGMGGVVSKDVPPHTIVAGNPARVIRINVVVEKGRIIDNGEKSR